MTLNMDAMTWELLKALFLFVLVLGLVWLTTRLVGARLGGATRGRVLRVLEHVPVGRDRSLLLVEAAGRVYLVGATAEHITLLDAIDDPEVIRRALEQPGTDAAPFSQLLDRVMKRPSAAAPPAAEADAERALQEQIERLRKLQGK